LEFNAGLTVYAGIAPDQVRGWLIKPERQGIRNRRFSAPVPGSVLLHFMGLGFRSNHVVTNKALQQYALGGSCLIRAMATPRNVRTVET
jgi:hypothetical protein